MDVLSIYILKNIIRVLNIESRHTHKENHMIIMSEADKLGGEKLCVGVSSSACAWELRDWGG